MYTATSNYFPVEAATHGAAYMHGAATMPTPFTAPSATMPIWPASTTVSVGYAPKPMAPLMDASAQERADGLSMMMPAPFAAANNGKCVTCGVKSAVNGTANCSRRCSWVAACRCPQCGRGKDPQNPYCSPSCCQQALQANWCPVCGVCQISNSGSCSNTYCAGATMFVCSDNRRSAAKSRPSTANRTPHEVLPASDPTRNQLNSAFVPSFQLGYATRIVSVIKINSIGTHKKRYLSYRSVVESTMSHLGLQKYGHGGEGNEQRRYFALNLQCTLGNVANGGHPGSNLQCCGKPTCEACQILTRGMNLQEMNRGSHYSTTTVQQSLPWTNPNPSGLRAILAARVVVGNADVVVLDPSDAAAPEINFPTNPDLVHSTILTNTDPSQDGTYVFRDDAVDPLFIVLVE